MSKRFVPPPTKGAGEDHFLDAQPARDERALLLPIQNIRIGKNIRSDVGDLTELLESIRANGIMNALLVAKTQRGLELVGGHRRLECAKRLGLKTVPVRLIEGEPGILALLDNLQREALSAWDTCRAVHDLLPLFATQRELAAAINKDESYVSKCLSIARSNPELERVQALSLHELFAQTRELREPGRKSSGALPGGRAVAQPVYFKENPKAKTFTLRINYSDHAGEQTKQQIIMKLEEILKRLRGG